MTDEELIALLATTVERFAPRPIEVTSESLSRLIALARKGAAVQKSKELLKTFVDGSPLDREDATLLYEHLESLYLEQTP